MIKFNCYKNCGWLVTNVISYISLRAIKVVMYFNVNIYNFKIKKIRYGGLSLIHSKNNLIEFKKARFFTV